jgi:hypothetical protein
VRTGRILRRAILGRRLVLSGRALSHLPPAVALNRIRAAHGLRRLPLHIAARRPGARIIRLARRHSHLRPLGVLALARARRRMALARVGRRLAAR